MKNFNNRKLSAVIIAKNAQNKITDCIRSLNFADEIVVIDSGSDDNTIEIAKKLKCRVFTKNDGSYSDWRNSGKDKALGDYLLYVDTDEVVDRKLSEEIKKRLSDWPKDLACYAIPRKNIIFGKWLKHGGWYPDYVIRLLKKERLIRWENDLHEQPVYNGKLGYFKNPLIHYKEKNLDEMIYKTNIWSAVEAKLMYEARHPKMNIIRFSSAILREFWFRFIKNLAFLDGGEGIIMGIYQIYSRFISYAKLWEMQIGAEDQKSKIKYQN